MSVVITKTKPVMLLALTQAMKQLVPALDGIADHGSTLVVTRLTGEFTEAEQQIIQTVWMNHDAEVIQADQAKKLEKVQKAKAKNPTQLTLAERVQRIEDILEVN